MGWLSCGDKNLGGGGGGASEDVYIQENFGFFCDLENGVKFTQNSSSLQLITNYISIRFQEIHVYFVKVTNSYFEGCLSCVSCGDKNVGEGLRLKMSNSRAFRVLL